MERSFEVLKEKLWEHFESAVATAAELKKFNGDSYSESRDRYLKAESNVALFGDLLLKAETETRARNESEAANDRQTLSK